MVKSIIDNVGYKNVMPCGKTWVGDENFCKKRFKLHIKYCELCKLKDLSFSNELTGKANPYNNDINLPQSKLMNNNTKKLAQLLQTK